MDRAKYLNGTTSQSIATGNGTLFSIVVNSHTSGTIKFWDNTAGSGTVILNTITLATGPQVLNFGPGISFYTGLFLTIGGTIDYTVLYDNN